MNFGEKWRPETAGTSSPPREDRRMAAYFKQRGGLLFTQVNVTYGSEGTAKYVDGIRIIDPPHGEGEMYAYDSDNVETIWNLLENHRVEVIEVHDWGFHVLGDCFGKATIIENEFEPPAVEKTVIVPDGQPNDPPVEQVYDKLGVNWMVIDP